MNEENYGETEAGKVVLYVTSVGAVRHTSQQCLKVKNILGTLLVQYEERDVHTREVQDELCRRMASQEALVPQLFAGGRHIGDAACVERLNEAGKLRKMLKPFAGENTSNMDSLS